MKIDAAAIAAFLIPILQPILLALGTALSAYLTVWIRAKVKNENVENALVRSKDVLFALVKAANQTLVTDLKKSGKFDAATQMKVKDDLIAQFKAALGSDGLKLLGYVIGTHPDALDAWISTHIEAAVHDVKVVAAAAAPVPPAATAPGQSPSQEAA